MALRNSNPQNATLSIRLYQDELETIQRAAKKLDITMAEYVRKTMLNRSKRTLKRGA